MGNEASVPAGTSSADTTCGTRVRPTTPAPAWLESTATSAEASWTEINDAGGTDKPPARETSGAVDGDGNLFLIGGRDAKDEYADVHVRGAAGGWFKPEPAGRPPRARSGHSVVATRDGLVVFGGLSHERGYLSDVQLLTATAEGTLEWKPVVVSGFPTPCGRDKHTAVAYEAAGARPARMLAFGGFGMLPPKDEDDEDEDDDEKKEGEKKEGETEDATEEGGEPAEPAETAEAAEAAEPSEPKGPAVEMGWFDETFELSMGWADGYPQWRWTKLECGGGEAPSARAAHAACALPTAAAADGSTSDKMIVFGGRAAAGRVDDLWVLTVDASTVDEEDNAAAAWAQPACTGAWPCARSFHSLAPLRTPGGRSLCALFGGLSASAEYLDELHLLDVGSWSWVRLAASAAAPAPSPRGCAVLAPAGAGALLLYGGSSKWEGAGATAFHDDAHGLDLGATLAAIDGAAAAAAAAVAAAPVEAEEEEEEEAPAAKKAKIAEGPSEVKAGESSLVSPGLVERLVAPESAAAQSI